MPEPYWTSRDGRHQIYRGDCRDILQSLSGIDAIVTDPPYGVAKAEWDDEFPTEWYLMAREIASTSFIMPGNWALPKCLDMVGQDYRDVFVLHLLNGMTHGPVSFGNWIPVVVAQKNHEHLGGQNHFSVVVDASERIDHPSPKPLQAMRRLLRAHTESDAVLLDPFMGSGTTGIACIHLGRRFIGIEISQAYCDIAVERMERELAQGRLFEPRPEPTQASIF